MHPRILLATLTVVTSLSELPAQLPVLPIPTREYLVPIFRYKQVNGGERGLSRMVPSQMPGSFGYGTLRDSGQYGLEGQVWYVPARVTGNDKPRVPTREIFHLKHTNNSFLDSLGSSEGGHFMYESNLMFGDVLPADQPIALSRMSRAYNSSMAAHTVLPPHEIGQPAVQGFRVEGPMAFGYDRYGTEKERLLTLRAAYANPGQSDEGWVEVSSNAVAGGSTWALRWKSPSASTPESYVNIYDYGRQIQTTINYRINEWAQSGDLWWLLTEGGTGDFLGATVAKPDLLFGSPVTKFCNDVTNLRQITESIPLEFLTQGHTTEPVLERRIQFTDANANGFVIFPKHRTGKEIDMTIMRDHGRPVMKYTSKHRVEVSRSDQAWLEIPAMYLDYKYSWITMYRPDAKTVTDSGSFTYSGNNVQSDQVYTLLADKMGVIASTSNAASAAAIGIYCTGHVSVGTTGPATDVKAVGFTDPGNRTATGLTNANTTYLLIRRTFLIHVPFELRAGDHEYPVYIITDTLGNVKKHMEWLAANGYG